MTKDEIKQLITEKIAGQGSAIDAASVLPAILNGIIDAIPDPYVLPAATKDERGGVTIGNGLRVTNGLLETSLVAPRTDGNSGLLSVPFTSFDYTPIEEAAESLGLTPEQVLEIPNQLLLKIGDYIVTRTFVRIDNQGGFYVQFGGITQDDYSGVGAVLVFASDTNEVSCHSFEI